MPRPPIRPILPTAAAALLASLAAAQPEWSPRFAFTGFDGGVRSITVFDPDGPGPRAERLYAGGWFDHVGGLDSPGLAAWNGKGWIPVQGCPVPVYRFFGIEPDSGRLLLSGENPNNWQDFFLYSWNGDAFTKLGAFDNWALSLDYWDPDGDGPAQPLMIVGGGFAKVQGGTASRLASWDGSKWAQVGGGVSGGDYAAIRSVASWDIDGAGPGLPALIVAGDFTQVGDKTIRYLAKWDGTTWTKLDGGVDGRVLAAALFDEDGPGPGVPALFVSGDFNNAGGQPIHGMARFDGSTWSEAGSPDGDIYWLQVVDADGEGPELARLIATGYFTSIGGQDVSNAAAWDGVSWTPFGTNLAGDQAEMAVFDADGEGPEPASTFTPGPPIDSAYTEPRADSIATLDGDVWHELAGGLSDSVTFPSGVFAMADYALGGEGPATLVIGGSIDGKILTWNGDSLLGAGADLCCPAWNWDFYGPYVLAAAVFDEDGPDPAVPNAVIGGWFERLNNTPAGGVARWDGTTWSPMGAQLTNATVFGLVAAPLDGEDPDRATLLAAGAHMNDPGGKPTGGILRWDGAAWQPFDAGIAPIKDGAVHSLAAVDPDGDGPALPDLYAAGAFALSDAPESPNIARWDGARWQPVGGGLDGAGRTLAAHDPDGDGPLGEVLIAGGDFISVGDVAALRIAQWDGQQWSAVSEGFNGSVHALASISLAGEPPMLYAGGVFTEADGAPASHVAAWDGSGWSALGAGTDGDVRSIALHDDDGPGPIAPALYVGGDFDHAGVFPSPYLARWGDLPPPACPADCDGSASLEIYDWLCFVAAFGAADPRADCDNSGTFDLFDYLCFVNSFNEGC